MKLSRSIARASASKAKQLQKEVAAVRIPTYGDEQLIRLAAEAYANWQESTAILRDEGLTALVDTQFGTRVVKHPMVEAERQFHAEYVARLYDLQLVTKDKKAVRSKPEAQKASDDPLEGLRVVG